MFSRYDSLLNWCIDHCDEWPVCPDRQAIDAAKAKGVKNDELAQIIDQSCKQYLPLRNDANYADDRRKDNVSHYILRIAYSRTEDLRKWFLRQVSLRVQYWSGASYF